MESMGSDDEAGWEEKLSKALAVWLRSTIVKRPSQPRKKELNDYLQSKPAY